MQTIRMSASGIMVRAFNSDVFEQLLTVLLQDVFVEPATLGKVEVET